MLTSFSKFAAYYCYIYASDAIWDKRSRSFCLIYFIMVSKLDWKSLLKSSIWFRLVELWSAIRFFCRFISSMLAWIVWLASFIFDFSFVMDIWTFWTSWFLCWENWTRHFTQKHFSSQLKQNRFISSFWCLSQTLFSFSWGHMESAGSTSNNHTIILVTSCIYEGSSSSSITFWELEATSWG